MFIVSDLKSIKILQLCTNSLYCNIKDRDLKPANILVSKDCQIRITDLGLARFMDDDTLNGKNESIPQTVYVVTRWYRCPELLISKKHAYNAAVDMWSVGCILAELFLRKPLFPGNNTANQAQLIFDVFGYSDDSNLGFTISSEASYFLSNRCTSEGKDLWDVIPDASEEAICFISAILDINPTHRATASEALELPYLVDADVACDYSNSHCDPPTPGMFNFEHQNLTADELKAMIREEVSKSSSKHNNDYFEVCSSPCGVSEVFTSSFNKGHAAKNKQTPAGDGFPTLTNKISSQSTLLPTINKSFSTDNDQMEDSFGSEKSSYGSKKSSYGSEKSSYGSEKTVVTTIPIHNTKLVSRLNGKKIFRTKHVTVADSDDTTCCHREAAKHILEPIPMPMLGAKNSHSQVFSLPGEHKLFHSSSLTQSPMDAVVSRHVSFPPLRSMEGDCLNTTQMLKLPHLTKGCSSSSSKIVPLYPSLNPSTTSTLRH